MPIEMGYTKTDNFLCTDKQRIFLACLEENNQQKQPDHVISYILFHITVFSHINQIRCDNSWWQQEVYTSLDD